jgi:molybdenum cofactor synthesis domain-containing protein
MAKYMAAVLTISDRVSRGERKDESGGILKTLLEKSGFEVVGFETVPDEQPEIKACFLRLIDRDNIPLVVTTGGTGVSPRDVTPEATRSVIDRELPGFAETMRAAGRKNTPLADISRAVCGIRDRSLIINLPGSPKAVREGFEAVSPAITHVLDILRGEIADCGIQTGV